MGVPIIEPRQEQYCGVTLQRIASCALLVDSVVCAGGGYLGNCRLAEIWKTERTKRSE